MRTYAFTYANALVKPYRKGKMMVDSGLILVSAKNNAEARVKAAKYYQIGVDLGVYKQA